MAERQDCWTGLYPRGSLLILRPIEYPGCDGAVWAVNAKALSQVTPEANLQSKTYYTVHGKPANLLNVPHTELWYKISLEVPDSSVCVVVPSVDNPRMNAQQSLFTMAGRICVTHDIIGDKLSNAEAFKIIVPKNIKTDLLKRLDKMNILATNLFPDITGIARRTRDSIRHNMIPAAGDFMAQLDADLEALRLPNRTS